MKLDQIEVFDHKPFLKRHQQNLSALNQLRFFQIDLDKDDCVFVSDATADRLATFVLILNGMRFSFVRVVFFLSVEK